MPTARCDLGVGVDSGTLFAVGGQDENSVALATVEVYRPTTST